jgi:hypothetical protein
VTIPLIHRSACTKSQERTPREVCSVVKGFMDQYCVLSDDRPPSSLTSFADGSAHRIAFECLQKKIFLFEFLSDQEKKLSPGNIASPSD